MRCKIRRLPVRSQVRHYRHSCRGAFSKWSKLNHHRNIDRTNRDGRFLTYEITTMDYPSCDSFIRLTTGNRRSDVVRFARKTLDQLLVYSQVFLSVALPFSIFPLIYFTSKKSLMGEFTNAKWNTFLGYAVAVILTILNFKLIFDLF